MIAIEWRDVGNEERISQAVFHFCARGLDIHIASEGVWRVDTRKYHGTLAIFRIVH